MSRFKKRLLVLVLLVAAIVFCDTMRSPENQYTASAYISVVHLYQDVGRPMLEGIVACRYHPTCSDYSIQAVERYGIVRGLYLTIKRLASCTNDVPMGTVDEVA